MWRCSERKQFKNTQNEHASKPKIVTLAFLIKEQKTNVALTKTHLKTRG